MTIVSVRNDQGKVESNGSMENTEMISDALDVESTAIAGYLKLSDCSVIRGGGRLGSTGNSVLRSCPQLRVQDLFDDEPDLRFTASLVEISGPAAEPPHFHTSHLVGVVVAGHGYLRLPDARVPITAQDLVIIPKGALHIFDADPGEILSYIAYEISREAIDYQKHFYDE